MTIQTFQKGAGENVLTYPLTRDHLREMKPCKLASPRVGKSHGYVMPPALCNAQSRAEALREVMEVRDMVEAGGFPRAVMEQYYPEDWGTFPDEIPELLANEGLSFDDPKGLANVVHMDEPDDLGRAMRKWLMSKGCVHKDADIRFNDFVANIPRTNAELAEAVHAALEVAFDVKYYFGLPRPEEVAGEAITAYPEGAPAHPTWPAGHGAAAFECMNYFAKNWRMVVDGRKVPLSAEILKELFDAAYVWSMSRLKARVHFPDDNLPFAPRKSEV